MSKKRRKQAKRRAGRPGVRIKDVGELLCPGCMQPITAEQSVVWDVGKAPRHPWCTDGPSR